MSYETMLVHILITMCASCVCSVKTKTVNSTLVVDERMKPYQNITEMSFNVSINATEAVDNNSVDISNGTFQDGNVNNSYNTSKDSSIGNGIFVNESDQIGNISNRNYHINLDQEKINISQNIDKLVRTHGDGTWVTNTGSSENVSWHEEQEIEIQHTEKGDERSKLKFEKKKVILQHHLQLGNVLINQILILRKFLHNI